MAADLKHAAAAGATTTPTAPATAPPLQTDDAGGGGGGAGTPVGAASMTGALPPPALATPPTKPAGFGDLSTVRSADQKGAPALSPMHSLLLDGTGLDLSVDAGDHDVSAVTIDVAVVAGTIRWPASRATAPALARIHRSHRRLCDRLAAAWATAARKLVPPPPVDADLPPPRLAFSEADTVKEVVAEVQRLRALASRGGGVGTTELEWSTAVYGPLLRALSLRFVSASGAKYHTATAQRPREPVDRGERAALPSAMPDRLFGIGRTRLFPDDEWATAPVALPAFLVECKRAAAPGVMAAATAKLAGLAAQAARWQLRHVSVCRTIAAAGDGDGDGSAAATAAAAGDRLPVLSLAAGICFYAVLGGPTAHVYAMLALRRPRTSGPRTKRYANVALGRFDLASAADAAIFGRGLAHVAAAIHALEVSCLRVSAWAGTLNAGDPLALVRNDGVDDAKHMLQAMARDDARFAADDVKGQADDDADDDFGPANGGGGGSGGGSGSGGGGGGGASMQPRDCDDPDGDEPEGKSDAKGNASAALGKPPASASTTTITGASGSANGKSSGANPSGGKGKPATAAAVGQPPAARRPLGDITTAALNAAPAPAPLPVAKQKPPRPLAPPQALAHRLVPPARI